MKEENLTTDFKDNPYQYTRTIRFKAEIQQQSQCFKSKYQWSDPQINLDQLVGLLSEMQTDLEKLLLYKDEDNKEINNKKENQYNELRWSRKLSVSKNWLKIWHKNSFHASIKNLNNKDSKYKLQDLKELHKDLETWLRDWKEKADQLRKYSQQPKESQVRHSDIAYIIRWFLNRQRLFYIQGFLNEAHTSDPNLSSQIENLKNNLEKSQKELKEAEKKYLSSKSSGIEIAKTSFNYYTVNKKPKEYNIEKKEEEKDKNCFTSIKNSHWYYGNNEQNFNQKSEIFFFKSDLEKEWIRRYIDKYCKDTSNENRIESGLQNSLELSLDQTYHAMKAFKAEQKSIFYELMKHIVSDKKSGSSYEIKNPNHHLKGCKIDYQQHNIEGINQIFSLFQFKDEHTKKYYKGKAREKYDHFLNLTKNIKENGNAKKRGQLLSGNNYYFTEYVNFCEFYKSVAQRRGKLIAQIKGIEKERDEAKQTSYWSLIYVTKDAHKQLWLISKDKIQNAKKFIDQLAKQNQKLGNSYLCCFESLTKRALHKLCFAEESSFAKEMPPDQKDLLEKTKKMETHGDNQRVIEKKQKELEVFKKVLQWQKSLPNDDKKKTLQLENFDLQATYQIQNLDEFEKALEKACYYIKKTSFNKEKQQKFIKDHDVTVLDITSYDLESRNKNTYQIPKTKSENRLHTDLWQEFWKNLGSANKKSHVKGFELGEIRLNPEVKIRYRKADEDLKKYLESKGFDKEFKKDRKFTQRGIQDQLTVTLTLALNAGKYDEELAFSKSEDLCEKINDFNAKFNSEKDFKTAWKYGIDRGQIELATLCLAKFDPDQIYEVKVSEKSRQVVQPEFASIECYTLKDYNHQVPYNDGKKRNKTHQKAVENLSYFIDEELLFDIKPTSCLDLTTAKVIKGNIVTNGDVMTYLKFKKVSAKRKLYKLYGEKKINSSKLEWNEYEDGKDGKDGKKRDYHLNIIDEQNKEETIYYYREKYKDIWSKDDIKASLDRYLNELKRKDESHTPSILQINHLRDALTANMVGVIFHLYKTHPGFVVLEDLWKKHKDFHHDASIARNLETALYNKFQAIGLVPPHVKDIIQLREDVREQQKKDKELIKSSQIGTIVFVDAKNTSKNCPYCEKPRHKEEKDEKDEKFKQHRFRCKPKSESESCNFDTYAFKTEEDRAKVYTPEVKQDSYNEKFQFLKDIDDPDKVAAYNIAKKLKDSKDIGKMELPKVQSQKDERKTNSRGYQNERNKNRNNNDKQKQKDRHLKSIKGEAQQKHSQELTNKPFANLKKMMVKKV